MRESHLYAQGKDMILALCTRTNRTHDAEASGSTFPAPNVGGAGGGLKGLYHGIFIVS